MLLNEEVIGGNIVMRAYREEWIRKILPEHPCMVTGCWVSAKGALCSFRGWLLVLKAGLEMASE